MRERVARRFGDRQRVPANLACPFVPAAVDQGLGVTGRHPGAESSVRSFPARACSQVRQTSASQSGSPDASMTSAVLASKSRSRRSSPRRATRLAVSCQPTRSPLRYRAAASPSSSRERSSSPISPSPADSACRYSRAASSNASASAATSAAASHASTARARSPGHEPSTRWRAICARCGRRSPSYRAAIASAAAVCSCRCSAARSRAATAERTSACENR